LLIGCALGVLTYVGLLATEQDIGVPRDESFYFRAGSDYAGWFKLLWNSPGRAFEDSSISRMFSYNSEHPGLMKELFGLSHTLFFEQLHWLRDIASYRVPSWTIAAIFAAVLYWFGAGLKGRAAGLFAVGAFFLTPRNWYHAHLACFDFPICAMWLFTVYAYWRAETSRRWVYATGVIFGLALATKHNAFFIPPTLIAHWLIVRGIRVLRGEGFVAFVKAIPHSFWSMAAFGPLTLYLAWPYLWHHPIDRVSSWIEFHLQHVHYAWFYLGNLMREPPFPIEYPFVVTAMTVPLAIVLAMTTGLIGKLVDALRSGWDMLQKRSAHPLSSDDWLLVLNGLASLLIIAPPSVPHFGGEKHWMPSMPFLCVIAGEVVVRSAALIAPRLRFRFGPQVATGALSSLMLLPALWGVRHIDGYGTSFYNELTEGNTGAAALGMQRQFWSNNVTGVLPWLNDNAPEHARVFFHEVTYDSYRAYQDSGMLRRDIQFANLNDAEIACYQYHQEFRFWEYNIWTNMKTQWPVYGLYLDEVPNIECYQRNYSF
jgi:hypothetical protein